MNAGDSRGFERIVQDMELLRAQRGALAEYPARDLRQWTIRVDGHLAGFVDQWGGSGFWPLIAVAPKLAAADLGGALTAESLRRKRQAAAVDYHASGGANAAAPR
jgi:hypothetical protein